MEDTIKVNILNLVKNYIKLGNSLQENFENMNEIVVDNNRKIILDSISITYDKNTNQLDYYRFSGYLLEK